MAYRSDPPESPFVRQQRQDKAALLSSVRLSEDRAADERGARLADELAQVRAQRAQPPVAPAEQRLPAPSRPRAPP